jgi:vacuolar-type H+-ATPase catalytic subunit A/Vma1
MTNKLESSIHESVYQMQDNSLSEDGNHDELNSRVEKVINSKIKSQDEHNLDKKKCLHFIYMKQNVMI